MCLSAAALIAIVHSQLGLIPRCSLIAAQRRCTHIFGAPKMSVQRFQLGIQRRMRDFENEGVFEDLKTILRFQSTLRREAMCKLQGNLHQPFFTSRRKNVTEPRSDESSLVAILWATCAHLPQKMSVLWGLFDAVHFPLEAEFTIS